MPRFRFRLERVLRHRERLKEAAMAQLVEARTELEGRERRVRRVEAARARVRRIRPEPGRTIPAGSLQVVSRRVERLTDELGRASAERRSARWAVAGRRQRMVEAHRDELKLVRLRDRRRREWQREELRREQRELDWQAQMCRLRMRGAGRD